MAGATAATLLAILQMQTMFSQENGQTPGALQWCPPSPSIDTITSNPNYDIIVVGLGAAGSVMTHDLSEGLPDLRILAIEEGGCPSEETNLPGVFTAIPCSEVDRCLDFVDDGYSSQYQKKKCGFTAGKMIGGTGGLDHMIYGTYNELDFESWAEATNDKSWGKLEKYFIKLENVTDEGIINQGTTKHGTDGSIKVTRQVSDQISDLIKATEELGSPYKSDTYGLCTTQPALAIGDGLRQWGNVAHSSKLNNSNVHVLSNARVTKVDFDGTTAKGVQFTFGDKSYSVSANKEIILTAGAVLTPQLLMLSGIGNKDELAKKGIDTVAHNPEVGQNMMEFVGAIVGISLDESTETAPAADLHLFPVPGLTMYDSLDKEARRADIMNIILKFSHDHPGLTQVSSNAFKYLNWISDIWAKANEGKNFAMVIPTFFGTKSKGSVTLRSSDINDQPNIETGIFHNDEDLEYFAKYLEQFVEPFINTKAMKTLGAEFVDLGICSEYKKFSYDYWKCYGLKMSTTMRGNSGTCAMGKVVDRELKVNGVEKLRVADASVFPSKPSMLLGSLVRAVAAKAAAMIIAKYKS